MEISKCPAVSYHKLALMRASVQVKACASALMCVHTFKGPIPHPQNAPIRTLRTCIARTQTHSADFHRVHVLLFCEASLCVWRPPSLCVPYFDVASANEVPSVNICECWQRKRSSSLSHSIAAMATSTIWTLSVGVCTSFCVECARWRVERTV